MVDLILETISNEIAASIALSRLAANNVKSGRPSDKTLDRRPSRSDLGLERRGSRANLSSADLGTNNRRNSRNLSVSQFINRNDSDSDLNSQGSTYSVNYSRRYSDQSVAPVLSISPRPPPQDGKGSKQKTVGGGRKIRMK